MLVGGELAAKLSRNATTFLSEILCQKEYVPVVKFFNLATPFRDRRYLQEKCGLHGVVCDLSVGMIKELESLAVGFRYALELGRISVEDESVIHEFMFQSPRHLCLFPQNWKALEEDGTFKVLTKLTRESLNPWQKMEEAVDTALKRMKRHDGMTGNVPRRNRPVHRSAKEPEAK